jgi:hypothetical protein
MSENRLTLPYTRDSHPHTGDPRVDPEARAAHQKPARKTLSAAQARRKLEEGTMVPAFFVPEQPVAPELKSAVVPEIPIPAAQSEQGLLERALRFHEGTPMFDVKRAQGGKIIIPRTEDVLDALFLGTLPTEKTLRIGEESLAKGKRKGTIIQPVGKSAYGAFVVVLYPAVDAAGKEIEIQMLADINRRTLRSQNEGVKFQESLRRLLFPYAK